MAGWSGLESTTAFGGDCLEFITVDIVFDGSSSTTSINGRPDGAVEFTSKLSPEILQKKKNIFFLNKFSH